MRNRIPTYPGRVKVTREDGSIEYVTLERADEPTEEGTPLNKRLLDFAVAACGVTGGTSTAFTLDDEFGGFELVDGAKVNFRLHVDSGAGATLDVNGTGAKAIANYKGEYLLESIPSSTWIEAVYTEALDAYVTDIPGAEYGVDLQTMTWEAIARLSESGTASRVLKVGDEKDIISTGDTTYDETLTVVIVGFDHDDKADGTGKAGIAFGLKNLMSQTYTMNGSTISSSTNVGGFTGSTRYKWLTGTMLPGLSADLLAVLKSVNKQTSAGNMSTTINTDAMEVFLFSEIEIFGFTTYSAPGEGSQYDYFATAENRVKYRSNGTGDANGWWGRSPALVNATNFCLVGSAGGVAVASSGINYGVCFGFCV